jgi:hypothetical protein
MLFQIRRVHNNAEPIAHFEQQLLKRKIKKQKRFCALVSKKQCTKLAFFG